MGRVSRKKSNHYRRCTRPRRSHSLKMLAREGAKVAVTDINGDGAEAVASAINAEHR